MLFYIKNFASFYIVKKAEYPENKMNTLQIHFAFL